MIALIWVFKTLCLLGNGAELTVKHADELHQLCQPGGSLQPNTVSAQTRARGRLLFLSSPCSAALGGLGQGHFAPGFLQQTFQMEH